MNKALVIQTAFLGDVILATPLASSIKNQFPNCEIHFLVKKGNESLLNNHQIIHKTWTFDKSNGKIKALKALIPALRKENYDVVYNLHRFGSSGIITALSGARKKVGFDKNPFSWTYSKKVHHEIGNGKHEVDRNLQLLWNVDDDNLARQPLLCPSEKDFSTVDTFHSETYYCLAPASVWYTKQTPKEKWVELCQLLVDKGQVILLGGPGDKDLCDEIIQTSGIRALNLAGKLSLLQSAALMKGAERNFVNDSGPLHLSSAVNAKVTAFFCSTTPQFGFGPLSDDSQIIEATESLDCKPCGLHGHNSCPKDHFKCGFGIDISKVKA